MKIFDPRADARAAEWARGQLLIVAVGFEQPRVAASARLKQPK